MRMDHDGLTETYDRSILMRDANNSVSLKILFTSFSVIGVCMALHGLKCFVLKEKQTNRIQANI